MIRPAALASLLLLALAACELVEDTGEACLVPKDLQCECLYPEEGFDCQSSWVPWEEGWSSCVGTYPADVSYTIEAELYDGGLGYGTKEQCEVELELDSKRIIFSGSFWHEPERDAIREPAVIVECETPKLTAGTYVFEFGGNETEVEIGGMQTTQDMVCVRSDHQHSRD